MRLRHFILFIYLKGVHINTASVQQSARRASVKTITVTVNTNYRFPNNVFVCSRNNNCRVTRLADVAV